MSDDLWSRVDVALIQARSRSETISEINRLMRKRFPDLPKNHFTEERCELRREWLTAAELAQFNPKHSRTDPHQLRGPLVACEHHGQIHMVDGTNRLNVWLRDGDTEQHETIIVRVRDAAP